MGKRLKLGEMLLAKGLIKEADLASALEEQRRWGKRLGMTLVLMGVLEEETLVRTLAAQLKLPVARIRGKRVNNEVIELVPVELAEKHRCLPLFVKEQGGSRELFLAMEDPSDLEAQGELGFRIGFRIRPVLVAPTELEDALQRHYHWTSLMGSPGPSDLEPAREASSAGGKRAEPEPEADPGDAPAALVSSLPEASDPEDSLAEPFEDTEPEVAAARPPAEKSGDTQPDPPDIERAAAELGAFGEDERLAAPRRTPPAPEPDAAPPRPGAISPDVILRALSQLLVEKGVLTRDELVERLRSLAARQGAEPGES